MGRLPVRLGKEPLIEAVWEVRFTGARSSVADLLPGLLFQALSGKYPIFVRLPAADIPVPIMEQDPNLKYVPRVRLEGGNQAVQIGEHVVSLNCRRPYSGWKTFSGDIRELIGLLRATALIDRVERFSLKYVDLIELPEEPSLNTLNLELTMGSYEMPTRPVQLRTEIQEDGLVHIVQIASPAEAYVQGESFTRRGVLLDVDSIRSLRESESWCDVELHLDQVHLAAKRLFFGMLTARTLASLDPQYEEEPQS